MEALDGLVQGVHTNDGAFVVLAQLLRGEPRKLRVSITDGFHAWYERDYAEAEWAAMCTAAGDVSEEAFAHRVQRGFTDGMLDPVQAADQRTFYVRVDALSTVSKVIEFRLDRIAESEKPTRIQQLLQSLVEGCQSRGGRIRGGAASPLTDDERLRRLEAENLALRQRLESSSSLSQSPVGPLRPPSPLRGARGAPKPAVKRKKGHSLVNPHVKRSKARGAAFSDELEPEDLSD